jgi:hypothetical protein
MFLKKKIYHIEDRGKNLRVLKAPDQGFSGDCPSLSRFVFNLCTELLGSIVEIMYMCRFSMYSSLQYGEFMLTLSFI